MDSSAIRKSCESIYQLAGVSALPPTLIGRDLGADASIVQRLRRFQFKAAEIDVGTRLLDVQDFDANNPILRIVVNDHAGPKFLRINNVGVIELDVRRIRRWIILQFHILPFMPRSK
jgi:hypothetical protein